MSVGVSRDGHVSPAEPFKCEHRLLAGRVYAVAVDVVVPVGLGEVFLVGNDSPALFGADDFACVLSFATVLLEVG